MPIFFGVDLDAFEESAVDYPIFSDRGRRRELWPNAVFAAHGFYPVDEF